MAHFALLWKARTIEKYRLNYESEKINSILKSHTQIPKQSMSQRWRHYRCDTQKRISRTFRRWYPEGSSLSNLYLYLRTDQTFPNFVLKSILGFVGGIVLTYLCFMFFVFQLSISLIHATMMSSIIGVLLTLGLAFSYRIRCLVFLLIPQFFSRVGRYTLTCYALVLILTGPATNTLKNSEVLSESLACGQEQIKTSVSHINTLTTKPLHCLKDSIKLMVDRLKEIAVKVKSMILKVNRLILSVAQVIQTGHLWLNSISTTRNEKLGTPYQRCMHALQDGIQSCKNRFGSNESTICNKSHSMKKVCIKIRSDFVYAFVEHLNGNMVPIIRNRLKNFSERIQHMFYMQVHVHHSYSFSSNSSRTASQVAAGIVTEIRKRADPLLTWLSWSSCVTSLFLLLIIFRAKYYQYMFETRSRFDNRYITKEIRNLDLKRLREGRHTILPLNKRERAKYVTTTSFRLVASEKAYLNRSVVFMSVTTFKLLVHMVADYSLYWVLMTIRYHGRLQTPVHPEATETGIHISGLGPIADLLKSIVVSLSVLMETPAVSPVSCLPNPYPPDFRRYKQIGVLIFLLWFFAMFEPYGLRLRHVVMGHYQPERAKTRAVWLYNHILRTRGGFLKFARRKLHRTYKYRTEEKLTFSRWLDNHIPFCWIRSCLGTNVTEPRCLLCGTSYDKPKPDTQLIRCKSASCPGLYCTSCFMDIGELCTICLSPEDYGDMSDVSLEKESSSSDDSDDNYNDSNYSICETGESDASTSNEVSRSCKRSMLSKSKTDCREMKPLISIRNYKLDDLGNCNHTLNLRGHLETAHMKASLIRHKKRYYDGNQSKEYKEDTAIMCQYCDHKHYDHCSFNMQRKDNSINSLSEVMRRVDNECMQIQMHQYDKINVEQVNGKQYNKFTKIRKVNHFKNDVKFLSNNIPRPLKSSARSTKFTSYCNFYRITLSQKTIHVHKIFKPTKLAMAVEKHLKAIFKFKMKRKSRTKNGCTRRIRGVVETCGSKHSVNQRTPFTPYSCSCGHETDIDNAGINKRNNSKADIQDHVSKKFSKSDNACSFYRYRRLKLLFSDFWNNMSSNVNFDFRNRSSTAKNNNTVSKVMENHKKRKKKHRKDNDHGHVPSDNMQWSDQNDCDDYRRYRISAFLSDQDWIKRHFKKVVRIGTQFNNECGDGTIEISEELAVINPLPSSWEKISGTQSQNNNIQHVTKVNNNMRHNKCNTNTEALPKKNEDIQLCNKGTEAQPNKNEDIQPSGTRLRRREASPQKNEDIEPRVLITNKVCNRGLTVMTDVCKKLACDLITFTSSNSYMAKITNHRRKKNKKETATAYPPAIERYLELHESIRHDDFAKLYYAGEDQNAEIDTMQDNGVSEESDSRDPYIVFSDVNSSARRFYFLQYNENIMNAASRLKSDLSERVANGLKCSLSICKNFCNGVCPVGVCSLDKLNGVSSHKPDKDKAKNKSGIKETIELYMKNEDDSQLYKISPMAADKELEKLPTKSCQKKLEIQILPTKNNNKKLELDVMVPMTLTGCQNEQVKTLPTKIKNEKPGVMDTTAKHPLKVYHNIYKHTSTKGIQTGKSQRKKTACDKVTNCEATTCSRATQFSNSNRPQTTKYDFSSTNGSGSHSSSISRKHKKRRRNVKWYLTKCDRSTNTYWPIYRDVSTTTRDWWSPLLVDRRHPKKVSIVDDARGQRGNAECVAKVKNMRQDKQTAVNADGKFVTFQNKVQIINTRSDYDYRLTPSRYLLESQKYYNELFRWKNYTPHLFAVNLPQKYSGHCSNKSRRHVTGTHHHNRRKYKAKRLEECYSPRTLISPRRLLTAGYEWKHVGDDWVNKRKKNHRTSVSYTSLESSDALRLSDACLL